MEDDDRKGGEYQEGKGKACKSNTNAYDCECYEENKYGLLYLIFLQQHTTNEPPRMELLWFEIGTDIYLP